MRRHFTMSMTRRISLLITSSLLPALLLAQPALARHADLYIDAAAKENGDGSREHPFWRITDGVVAARALRQHHQHHHHRVTLHVLPGTYVGSYDPDHLAGNPRLELLPIILNVSNLNLVGGTELDQDSDGLPMGTYPRESETLLTTETDLPLSRGQMLLLIASTTDGVAGNKVSVSGFVLDAQALALEGAQGFDIYADRVSEFSIHHNLLRGGPGVQTRLALGMFEANFVGPNPNSDGAGIFITGGSMVHPASVTLRRNRSTRNAYGASIRALANFVELRLGANPLMLEPLQMTYDRNNPEDVRNIPDTLEITIEGNDFSDNSFLGFRCAFYPPFFYTTTDATQPITGSLSVAVRDNEFNRNFDYGIIVDPANATRSNPRQLTGSFEGTFERNVLIGNGRNASGFAFTAIGVSTGRASRADVKYMQESTFQVADPDGELGGFDYDHPLIDPFDDSPVVGNVLLYNGEVQPNGIMITPRP